MGRHRLVLAVAILFLATVASCSTGSPTGRIPPASPAQQSSTPLPSPTPPSPTDAPAPAPAPASAPAPTTIAVGFSGLPTGTYPVHVHSICSGRQSFHITVVESLDVGSGGRGIIEVPSSYFGRGLCLIVYTSPSLSAVLTTRPI